MAKRATVTIQRASTNGAGPRVKSKPVARRVYSDDVVVTIGDEQFYPHVGEYVEFRPGASTGTFQLLIELQSSLPRMAEMDSDDRTRFAKLLGDCATEISLRVRSWNWTDIDDVRLPSPPKPEHIRALDFNEMTWLLANSLGSRNEQARKNGESPST